MDKVIVKGAASQEATESMIGRLNHASYVIPLSCHFLNELRQKCLSTPRNQRQTIRFTKEELADLSLWQLFLDMAHRGMSINLLVLQTPTRIAWSDSCPFGIGGYTLQGNAWRVRVLKDCPFYGDDSVNNVLEFPWDGHLSPPTHRQSARGQGEVSLPLCPGGQYLSNLLAVQIGKGP